MMLRAPSLAHKGYRSGIRRHREWGRNCSHARHLEDRALDTRRFDTCTDEFLTV